MKKPFLASILLMSLAAAALAQPGDIQSLSRQYDYDAGQPLEYEEAVLFEREGIDVYDISYASPAGGRVTAYLVVPEGEGPFAGLVFGHWGPGTRTEFLPEAMIFAEAGAVSLMIDYPWVRPAPWRVDLKSVADPEADHAAYVQAVVDLRRGIDLLLERPGVDPERLAYIGHSFGAQWGAILSAVDDRVKAAVLMGGVPDLASIYLENDEPDVIEFRESTPAEAMEEYLRVNAATDAIHYVPYAAPTPLLFQFARRERYFNEAAMERYAGAASEPKVVIWYETGHELNDVQALIDRAEWLQKRIGTGSIAPVLERMLEKR